MIPTNFTEFRIQNPGERCLLIGYLTLVFLSSLIGDSVILIASVKFGAIKLHRFIVAVMQHIAVCHLLRLISFVLPTIACLITDSWIRKESPGYGTFFLDEVSHGLSRTLITFLTTSKLFIVKFPLRTKVWTSKAAHVICALFWLYAMTFQTYFLSSQDYILFFSYIEYNVRCDLTSKVSMKVVYWHHLISCIIPSFIIVVTTTAILCHLRKAMRVSRRSGGNVRWHGMVAVSITAIVFCVAAIPVAVSYITIKTKAIIKLEKVLLIRFSHFMSALNIMCSIYIYCFTLPSFRRFVKSNLLVLLARILKYCWCIRSALCFNKDRPEDIEAKQH